MGTTKLSEVRMCDGTNPRHFRNSNPERSDVHTPRDLFNTSRVHNREKYKGLRKHLVPRFSPSAIWLRVKITAL